MKEVEDFFDEVSTIQVRKLLWKRGDFDFIVKGENEDGDIVSHEKQRQALQILTSNKYKEFLYGGAAGGAKTVTGVAWLAMMCLCYPGTRYFVGRNELSDIVDSVLVTFKKFCRWHGITSFKFNAQKNFIEFDNGSYINFIELKYKPSDPMFEDVGSTEYTAGWIEEVGETHPTAAIVMSTRVGRHLNKDYNIKGILFYTCNPKKNWAKTNFYDLAIKNKLPKERYYLQCLVTDNPFIEKDYIENLRLLSERDKSLYERLFKGNWEYEDNPNALCDYEMIEQIWENDHVQDGVKYITADVARYGSDKAVVFVWAGYKVIDYTTMDISKTTDIEHCISLYRRKYGIPKNRCVADADGVGGGVIDGTGILGFVNNSKAIKQKGVEQNYANLKTQCMYLFSDKINNGEIWVDLDLGAETKHEIMDEIYQIQSRNKNDRKLHVKSKDEVKQDIGRSPDYLDALMMRMFFDLRPAKRRSLGSRPRNTL